MVCVNQLVDQSRSLYVPLCPWYGNDTKIIKHVGEHNLGHTRRGVDKNKEGWSSWMTTCSSTLTNIDERKCCIG